MRNINIDINNIKIGILILILILRYPNETHLGRLNLIFLNSLIMKILLCLDWSGKLLPVAQTQEK